MLMPVGTVAGRLGLCRQPLRPIAPDEQRLQARGGLCCCQLGCSLLQPLTLFFWQSSTLSSRHLALKLIKSPDLVSNIIYVQPAACLKASAALFASQGPPEHWLMAVRSLSLLADLCRL